MMANGALVRVLIHTDVTKYLNFKAVDGSFVYNKGKVSNVFIFFFVFFTSFMFLTVLQASHFTKPIAL